MLEFLRQLTSGITETWGRLSINARVQIGVSAVLTLFLLAGAMYMGTRPQFAQAYNGLELSESNEITVYLEDQSIPYRVRDGGRAIDIPAKHISEVRVYLAGQGIPKSQGVSPDFGLFDRRDLMTNKFLQDMDYMRAINGTLQRQLNEFDFVRNSTVMIREAKQELFRDNQQPSEAVVTLELVGSGNGLSETQKKAIVHTISTFGGGNLSTNNITVTTTAGDLVHSPVEDQFASLVSSRHEQEIARESERERKIEASFARLGKKAIINVSAIHDWTTEDTLDTKFETGIPIATMSKTMDTTTKDGVVQDGGAPGATANIPDAGGDSGTSTVVKEKEDIENLELPSTVTNTTKDPGRVRKYMVAAIIEGDYTTSPEGERSYTGLTPDQITKFQEMIRFSVGEGYETESTDITIMDQPFDVSPMEVPATAMTASLMQNPQLWQAVQGFLILLSFILLRIFIRRAMVLPTTEVEEVIEMPKMSEEDRHAMDISNEVERLSQEEPETVAALLRTWMAEDD